MRPAPCTPQAFGSRRAVLSPCGRMWVDTMRSTNWPAHLRGNTLRGLQGIVVLTSRVSVEMVQKSAAIGAPVIVAVSAPTALAVRMADAAGMTLVAIARKDGFEVFTHATPRMLEPTLAPQKHIAGKPAGKGKGNRVDRWKTGDDLLKQGARSRSQARCNPNSAKGMKSTMSPPLTSVTLSPTSIRPSASRRDEIRPDPSRANFATDR